LGCVSRREDIKEDETATTLKILSQDKQQIYPIYIYIERLEKEREREREKAHMN
jgi:hypothetical protein